MRSAFRYGAEHGIRALLGRYLQTLKVSSFFTKQRPLEDVAFVTYRSVGGRISQADVASNTVNWFIPLVGRGSGGHLNIFRFIQMLEKDGFECRIIVSGDFPFLTAANVKMEISSWYLPLQAEVYIGLDNAPAAAISFATAWQTAYDVRNFQATLYKCYFVQDFEPWFYAAGTTSNFAEDTYRFGFIGVTAGTWLSEKLSREYGMTAHAVGFSYDRMIYRPMPRKTLAAKQIFFYARPSTPRRGFELGLLVLAEVARRMPDATVVLAGSDLSEYEIPFKHVDMGVVDIEKLPDLYSQCDVALVLSFSNVSLLPLELMACGVPVVSNRAPYTEWLLDMENSRVEVPRVEVLADAICAVLQDPLEARRLRDAGLRAAAATDWAQEGVRMAKLLRGLTNATGSH